MLDRIMEELQEELVPMQVTSGLGEPLYVGLNVNSQRDERIETFMGSRIIESVTVNLYGVGTGFVHREGQTYLLGHRDLYVMEDSNGDIFLYTDIRTHDHDILYSSSPIDRTVDEGYFDYSNDTIQRACLHKEYRDHLRIICQQKGRQEEAERIAALDRDPYAQGLGSFMQAVALSYVDAHHHVEYIRTGNLGEKGRELWARFGIYLESANKHVINLGQNAELREKIILDFI